MAAFSSSSTSQQLLTQVNECMKEQVPVFECYLMINVVVLNWLLLIEFNRFN